MPRLLLETHLGVMERQLSRAIPARRNEYRTLLAAQEVLRDARTRAVDEQAAGQIVDEFVATLGGESRWLLRGTAMLLVSAVSDQRAGIGNATSSLREWLCDIEGLRTVAARVTGYESRGRINKRIRIEVMGQD